MTMYAIYSEQQAEFGTFICRRLDGTEVEVTAVEKIRGCPDTKFSDKQDLGEVINFVREGKPRR